MTGFASLLSLVTPDVLGMQSRLFGPATRSSAPLSDAAVWGVLHRLRASPELAPFRIWLVGSRIEANRETSDVDLVLAPSGDAQLTDAVIDGALWYCRDYGISRCDPLCVTDAVFRRTGPKLDLAALEPGTLMGSIKLLSPLLLQEVLTGRIREYRRIGRFSIEYDRHAGDMTYYRKLPRRRFDGADLPYLRPAIEVT